MIDVSSYQGTIDWQAVKDSGVERVYIKLGEDGYGIDRHAIANIHGARAAGLTPGLYWFAHPGHHTPKESADAFAALGGDHILGGDIPPALDLEVAEGLSLSQLNKWKADWFANVDPGIGCRAVFYSFVSFIDAFTFYEDRPIWGAHPKTISAAQQARWFLWQRGTGPVPGIEGVVDLDTPLFQWRPGFPAVPAAV
jgi:lysozyme